MAIPVYDKPDKYGPSKTIDTLIDKMMQDKHIYMPQYSDFYLDKYTKDGFTGAKADMVIIDDVEPPPPAPVTDDYLKDEDAARAWRELWKKLKKYNPKLAKDDKKNPIKSYLTRALAEVERLQALDRTLARRLKA